MSRIGLSPIKIEDGVTVDIQSTFITVTGKLGSLEIAYPSLLKIEVKDGQIILSRTDEEKFTKSIHGTIRSIIANAVNGVKTGYEKKLELVGVGYRVKMVGTTQVSFTLGFTHPVVFDIPEGVTVELPDEVTVIIRGFNKQVVGLFAAKIRSKRKPEPYKGKGIKYSDEIVKRKSSKASAGKK